eukprot:565115-Rhodomonas_salina.2
MGMPATARWRRLGCARTRKAAAVRMPVPPKKYCAESVQQNASNRQDEVRVGQLWLLEDVGCIKQALKCLDASKERKHEAQ